ncbi:MAG TPA: hypothetical protein VGM49_02750 [Candidatus Limnocylindrales bacterium]|jgi:hypothetical protein
MTLPFRRRHHDDESSHDRARALTSIEMLEPLAAPEASWLAVHLDGCAECRRDREAYLADRELLRSLRDHAPEPPRDLWARTSAALDREARHRPARQTATQPQRRFPLAPAAGLLILLVAVSAAIGPSLFQPTSPPSGTEAAIAPTIGGVPTPITVAAEPVGWVRQARDGSWELVLSKVDAVCPRAQAGCGALGEDVHGRSVALGNTPTSMTISPDDNTLVVESPGQGAVPDKILVVPVPSASPVSTPEVEPTSPVPSTSPETAPASPAPSSPIDAGVIEIASGVTVVGETAYSLNGEWLAFSARPSDGSTGPDLYLWHVGDPSALPVTTDHQTYFSAWLGNQVLASHVDVAQAPDASADASADPSAVPNDPSAAPTAAADATSAATAASPVPDVEAHPSSFLLDPATRTRADIAQPDVWLPVVDTTGRFVAFWSGTLTGTANGFDWRLGTGSLVLDGWSSGVAPTPSASPKTPAATTEPAATILPVGPVGAPVDIVEGPATAFTSKFDPTGTRLAVWVADDKDATVGRLYLRVLDRTTGTVDQTIAPLPGVPALRRFSIEEGRLAWVSPPGQDGQESSVQVLGWSHDNFGEVRTIPSKDLYIVR